MRSMRWANMTRADLLDRLGQRFWIEQLTFKPWPSCRGTHPFIELALALRERHAIAPDEHRGSDGPHRRGPAHAGRAIGAQAGTADADRREVLGALLHRAGAGARAGRSRQLHGGDAGRSGKCWRWPRKVRRRSGAGRRMAGKPGSGGGLAIRLDDGTVLEAETADALGCPSGPCPRRTWSQSSPIARAGRRCRWTPKRRALAERSCAGGLRRRRRCLLEFQASGTTRSWQRTS